MSGIGTPALSSTGGGGSSTITSFLGSTTNAPMNITQVGGSSISLGQKAMSASFPVVIASDQTSIPVTATQATVDTVVATNSSTSTLLANATFTGTGTSTLGYTSIEVLVYSDQNSAAGGVQIQFSSDNSNWDDASTYTFTAGNAAPNAGQVYLTGVRAKFFRTVYTNGGTGQGTFRLSSILKTGHPTGESIPMSDVPTALGSHGLLTKSAIVGKTTAGGGAFVDVKVNPSGALTTASTTQDSAGNSITSNSTTTTSTFGLDVNIRSILNTAPTTPGFLDIKGADGNVFVRQATAANLNATVVGTGTFAVQEATLDAAIVSQGTALGTIKNLMTAGSVTTAAPTYTTGQISPLSLTTSGALRVDLGSTGSNTNKILVTPDANSAVNVAQINGVTPLMGNGTTGTGSQRVTIASDNTVLPGVGAGATGSAVPANAVYNGGNAATALPTAATAGNLTGAMYDKFGRQAVVTGTIRDLKKSQTTTITVNTETTVVTAGAAGIFNDIVMFLFTNTSATGVRVDIRDATAGSVIFSIWVPATDTRGFAIPGETLPQTSAANNWTATVSTAITDLRVFAIYEQNK